MDSRTPLGRQKPKLMYTGVSATEKGWLSEPHRHEFTEVSFLKEGSGKLLIDKETYPLKKGDLVILNRGTLHSEFVDENAPHEMIFVAFDNLRADDGNILKNKNFCIVPTGDSYDAFLGYFTQLLNEEDRNAAFSDAIRERLVQIILLLILRMAENDLNLVFNKSSAFIEAKDYFDQHFTEIDSLQDVCDALYINRFYLTHIFKEQTGVPPVKYITSKRMELAQQLLSSGDLDIGVIAKQCGYTDAPYCCRVCKKTTGQTPLQFRYNAKLKKNN